MKGFCRDNRGLHPDTRSSSENVTTATTFDELWVGGCCRLWLYAM